MLANDFHWDHGKVLVRFYLTLLVYVLGLSCHLLREEDSIPSAAIYLPFF